MARTDTRTRILQAAYALFYSQGFARVSVDAIAARAGVTKRTVYYHFKSKDDIAGDVLATQHVHLIDQFSEWVRDAEASPEAQLDHLFRNLQDWAGRSGWLGSGFSRLSLELADLPGHPARVAARLHKSSVERWLATQLQKADCPNPSDLARQVMILIEGAMSLALIHGDTAHIASAAEAARTLVRCNGRSLGQD